MTDGARFRVESTRVIPGRPHFFLVGKILEGTVRIGMVVTAGPAHRPSFREAIDTIEAMDLRAERKSFEVLAFRVHHPDEAERWRAMPWEGVTLDIPPRILHPCPCCGFRTLADEERGGYDICDVCGWEDDYVQVHDPDYRGGANSESLNEARAAFFAENPHLPVPG